MNKAAVDVQYLEKSKHFFDLAKRDESSTNLTIDELVTGYI